MHDTASHLSPSTTAPSAPNSGTSRPTGDLPSGDGAAGTSRPGCAGAVLDLRVRNHPGTMSHITGLFARRAFNLEAILCVPEAGAETSRILLLLPVTPRLDQVELQLAKLHDVLEVRHRPDLDAGFFARLGASLNA